MSLDVEQIVVFLPEKIMQLPYCSLPDRHPLLRAEEAPTQSFMQCKIMKRGKSGHHKESDSLIPLLPFSPNTDKRENRKETYV